MVFMSVEKSYSKIIYIAPLIYFVYGACRYFFLDSSMILNAHVITIFPMYLLALSYNYIPSLKSFLNINRVLIGFYLIVHVNEQLLAYNHGYLRSDLVSVGILSVAITFAFWIKSLRENTFIYLLGLSSFSYAIINSDAPEYKILLIVSFFLLFVWKFVNDYYIKKYHSAFEKDNKLVAYKETVGLLNHEFNNVIGITLMLLKRAKKSGPLSEQEEELEKVLKKITTLVQELNSIQDYETEDYTQGIKITKIKNQPQPQD